MLRSRFFWKLYLALATLVVLTLAVTGLLVHQQRRAALLADAETRLLDLATSLTPFANAAFTGLQTGTESAGGNASYDPAIQAEIERMGRQTGTRITLVARDGLVIADSERDPRAMENHATRPEILEAQNRPYAVARRFSTTLGQPTMYVATPVRDGDRLAGTVRTATPLAAVDARLAALRNTIVLGGGLGILIALAVGLFVARRITAPVAQMTEVAEALRAGRYDRRVVVSGTDEFGLLGATLNRLADELTHRIATLAEQRAQLEAMVSGLQDGVFAVDERDSLIFHNSAADSLLELSDALVGGEFWDTVDVPELATLCKAARSSGSSATCELRVPRGDVEYMIDARATSFETQGRVGVVVLLRDMTPIRRLETMRTEFVANVSHELKTPLTSIGGYVETLIDGAIHDEENNLRFLHKIEQQVERLTAMVSDVLSLARIEASEENSPARAFDWRSVIESTVERYREDGKLTDHQCEVVFGDEAINIAGDSESMTQVLDNLLDNAIKYTPTGGKITVRARNEGRFAILEVEDTGIGISAADRQRIFERFFRADRARSRNTGGTGLGLAIVKHLVQSFGGEVHVRSELGRGSSFAVWAPTPTPGGRGPTPSPGGFQADSSRG